MDILATDHKCFSFYSLDPFSCTKKSQLIFLFFFSIYCDEKCISIHSFICIVIITSANLSVKKEKGALYLLV